MPPHEADYASSKQLPASLDGLRLLGRAGQTDVIGTLTAGALSRPRMKGKRGASRGP